MSSEEKGRKAKIIVLSIILAIVVIFIIVVAVVEIVKLNRKNAPPAPEPEQEQVIEEPKTDDEPEKVSVFTNSYNESITKKILDLGHENDAYDYVATYEFVGIARLDFADSVTEEQKQQFYAENGCRNYNDYRLKFNEEKLNELKDASLVIDNPINEETGTNEAYGTYTYTLNSKTLKGKVYGDRNLAVLVQDDTNDTEYYFISLNYKNFKSAVDVDETANYNTGTLYLFQNYYKNGKLFYSVTYIYEAV